MAAPAAIDTDGMQAEIAGFITLHWPELRARLGDLLDGFIDVACANCVGAPITSPPRCRWWSTPSSTGW